MSKYMDSLNTKKNFSAGISIRLWSSIAIAGFLQFILIIVLLHIICPEFDPLTRFMSEYALSEYGWLLTIALIGMIISCVCLTIILYHAYTPPLRSQTGIICIGVAGIASILTLFPVDLYAKAITMSGHLHNFGGLVANLALLVGMLAISLRLEGYGQLQSFYNALYILAFLAPIFFLSIIAAFNGGLGFVGLAQRLFVLIILSWLIIISYGIRSGAITPGE